MKWINPKQLDKILWGEDFQSSDKPLKSQSLSHLPPPPITEPWKYKDGVRGRQGFATIKQKVARKSGV